ncbi:MAG: hypothetical protein ABSD64_03895 [Terriglobales bacterium]|jgi:hypothetical protein
METIASEPDRENFVNLALLSTAACTRPQACEFEVPAPPEKKIIGYGMPCAKCHAYYPADMNACPICKSPDRVSPTDPMAIQMAAGPQPAADAPIDPEHERLLKEFKSQAVASHTQINAPPTLRCVLQHQHNGASEPAAVCHSCYSEARQRADRVEAVLHMDAKEAGKIVYDAVWADTSDPERTYLNAASALLSELRKRAGIGLPLGANSPLAH